MREVWRKFWAGDEETEGLVIAWTLIICGALVLASYYTSGGFGQLGGNGEILVLIFWVAIVVSTTMLAYYYFYLEGGSVRTRNLGGRGLLSPRGIPPANLPDLIRLCSRLRFTPHLGRRAKYLRCIK